MINLKQTSTLYEAVRGGVKLDFTHNSNDNAISGNFTKPGEGEGVVNHLGNMHVGASGYPNINLNNDNGTFISDWKTCVDLVNDAINHINNLPA